MCIKRKNKTKTRNSKQEYYKEKTNKEKEKMINLIYTILSIACLSAGFYFGFKIGKTSEMPKVPEKIKHPIKVRKEEKEQEEAENRLTKELKNLDNFDGTPESQEDI